MTLIDIREKAEPNFAPRSTRLSRSTSIVLQVESPETIARNVFRRIKLCNRGDCCDYYLFSIVFDAPGDYVRRAEMIDPDILF